MPNVSVLIPVGPWDIYKQWLPACVQSVVDQTHPAEEILLVDDMMGIEEDQQLLDELRGIAGQKLTICRNPWRIGDCSSFNCGIAVARNELVFNLSCDDMIRNDALELCVREWEKHNKKDGYYYVGRHYINGEFEDANTAFCGGMTTKGFWKMTGGFPLEGAIGAGDFIFLCMALDRFPDRVIMVAHGAPVYLMRYMPKNEWSGKGPAWPAYIQGIRDLFVQDWLPPRWGRYNP